MQGKILQKMQAGHYSFKENEQVNVKPEPLYGPQTYWVWKEEQEPVLVTNEYGSVLQVKEAIKSKAA